MEEQVEGRREMGVPEDQENEMLSWRAPKTHRKFWGIDKA